MEGGGNNSSSVREISVFDLAQGTPSHILIMQPQYSFDYCVGGKPEEKCRAADFKGDNAMEVTIEGKGSEKVLVVRIPMQKPTPSASGKTKVVATSHGNQETDAEVDGHSVVVGLNAYIRSK